MAKTSQQTANIKYSLEKLPGIVSIEEVRIERQLIEHVSIRSKSLGRLTVQRLRVGDSSRLYDFYFQGLSAQSQNFFPPYPLFSPPVSSAQELEKRIADWEKENDWTVLTLVKDERIIGIGMLKRFKTDRPTSGIAIREEYHRAGMGRLLQTLVNEQARLLNLKILYATVAPDNVASLQLHLKCGFRKTGKLIPHYVYRSGLKEIDRQDIELTIDFNG